MAKRRNWEKYSKQVRVQQERGLAALQRVHEFEQDLMVKAFFNFVEYHKAKGLPVPEFDVNECHKWA